LTRSAGEAIEVRIRKEVRGANGRTAEKLLRETVIEVSAQGDTVNIRVRYPRFHGLFFWLVDRGRVKVTSQIAVPASTKIRARLMDGAVTATGLQGEIDLGTVDGDIRIDGAEGIIRAESTDGSITLENLKGDLEARTIDGRIRASGLLAGLRLSSTDGEISVRVAPGTTPSGAWDIHTTDGDVELALPSGFAAEMDARAGAGRIFSEIPFSETRESSKRRLTGRLESGGSLITIRTGDGSIRITRS
jgi:DUF4097 and DUF4098 domain-containing protein YvlB